VARSRSSAAAIPLERWTKGIWTTLTLFLSSVMTITATWFCKDLRCRTGASVVPRMLTMLASRHADTVVYLDPETNQLVPYNSNRGVDTRSRECPRCGRPWPSHGPASSPAAETTPHDDQPTFITRDYFQMLARSLPGSNQPSRPPSPRRRIAQPVRSGLTSSPSSTPPPGAEFIGSSPALPTHAHGISETAFAPRYFERFFVEERELGRGGRGVVLLVKHVLDGVTLGHFACKRVPIGDDHTWLEKVLVEVQLLQNLSHQNLVSYRHVWLEDYQISTFGPSVPCAFILQQYCNGGDMHNYVLGSAQASTTTQELKERIRRRSKGETDIPKKMSDPKKLSFDEIYSFFRDIASGIRFLHANNFIHRDLKPSNCLLHTTAGETRVLVSDFGEVQYEYAARKSTGATGTISYCAPEVLRRVSPGGPYGNFTSKSDIFSLGMILHFLCFANLPYHSADVLHEEREDLDELRAEIMAWEGFDDQRKLRPELPSALYAFLKRLLSLDPDQRPSADDVLHGISSGRLDDLPAIRRRNSTADPEELTPGRRIQRLDTSTPGNSPELGARPDPKGKSNRSRARPRSKSRGRSKTGNETAVAEADDSSDGREESVRGLPPGHRNASIVLRPRHAYTSPLPSPRKKRSDSRSPEPRQPPRQLLLEPPEQNHISGTFVTQVQQTLNAEIDSAGARVMILVVKILTTLQPCLTRGLNAKIVYPIIAFAVIELTIKPYQAWKAALAMALHLIAVTVAMNMNQLCQSGNTIVSWDEE